MKAKLSRRQFVAGAAGAMSVAIGSSGQGKDAEAVGRVGGNALSQQAIRLQKLLRIRYPIIQAPTGGVVSSDLTAAVANSGALGAIPLSWSSPPQAANLISAVRAKTDGAFFVNFVLTFKAAALESALESGARVVQFSWGMPDEDLTDLIRSNDGVIGIQVTSMESARTALARGADYLVCQGTEAGGHVHASMPLARALDEVIAIAGDVPVVASGGIATGKKMHECMERGAAGVVMGSRFVASRESAAHDDYKRALVAASADDTVMTTCMNKGWDNATHRVLRNSTFRMWESDGCPSPGSRPGEKDTVARSGSVEQSGVERYSINSPGSHYVGNVEAMANYAGMSVDSILDTPGAGEIVERVWQEFLQTDSLRNRHES